MGIIPHDSGSASREIPHMAQEELLRRIGERLKAANLSERKALLRAGVGVDFIRDIRRRGHSPKLDKLAAFARAVDTPLSYFTDATEPDAVPGVALLSRVIVKAAVQAGVWREATEWPEDDWYSVTVPADERYPGMERFGLVVRGTSMDRLYPEGTIVLAVRFGDLGRTPNPGERVVVLRRDRRGEFEATLKEFDVDVRGRILLWPRSSDPEFQSPIILGGQIPMSFGDEVMPTTAMAGNLHEVGSSDVMIAALVVGSYREE